MGATHVKIGDFGWKNASEWKPILARSVGKRWRCLKLSLESRIFGVKFVSISQRIWPKKSENRVLSPKKNSQRAFWEKGLAKRFCFKRKLGGGLKKIFYFHPYLGEWSNLTSMFFKWVGSTTRKIYDQQTKHPRVFLFRCFGPTEVEDLSTTTATSERLGRLEESHLWSRRGTYGAW